ncbi:MAG: hypothetical protein WBP16_16080 [Ferruginibacter sp.]
MKKIIASILISSLYLSVFTACNKSDDAPSYQISTGSLSISLVDTSVIAGLVPLGNLNPPGHTFPTDHMYIYFKTPGAAVPVKAPGNLHIFQISRFRNNPGTVGETSDYRIDMGDPAGTVLYFSHLSSLSPLLETAAAGFSGASCEIYSTGGTNIEYCRKAVSLDVSAGNVIGAGNETISQFAIDMGFTVNNIAVCPLDYFNATAKALLELKLGNTTGTIRRTTTPLCGEINHDVAGTLQGNWYKQGAPRSPEDAHIAFVKDNVEPAKLRISIGSGVSGLASDVYNFLPVTTGVVDRPFTSVTNNGQVFCYNPLYYYGAPVPNTSIIIKLEDNGNLSFEKRNCDCSCNQPYTFTAAKITYTK